MIFTQVIHPFSAIFAGTTVLERKYGSIPDNFCFFSNDHMNLRKRSGVQRFWVQRLKYSTGYRMSYQTGLEVNKRPSFQNLLIFNNLRTFRL